MPTYPAHLRRLKAVELGAFQGSCDDDGNVYVTADSLMTMIEEATNLDELRETVARHTGKAWEDAFAAIRQAAMADAVP